MMNSPHPLSGLGGDTPAHGGPASVLGGHGPASILGGQGPGSVVGPSSILAPQSLVPGSHQARTFSQLVPGSRKLSEPPKPSIGTFFPLGGSYKEGFESFVDSGIG
ncbi:hypothetical protein WR25_11948 [Diploscapter pachys]|uniref:Uncharacterized protein n=1 Tax=Diploscapter pachys TaxID=2018661 RepID=A0A2A2LKH0_9BILA|nr:hypothetical protein WR25_11948 [Diploscapter pachys]